MATYSATIEITTQDEALEGDYEGQTPDATFLTEYLEVVAEQIPGVKLSEVTVRETESAS